MILSSFSFSIPYSHSLLFEDYFKNIELNWLKNEAGVNEMRFFKLLTELDNGANTLSLQLFFEDMEQFMEFELNKREEFFNRLDSKFLGNYYYFHSLLEEF